MGSCGTWTIEGKSERAEVDFCGNRVTEKWYFGLM